MMLVPSYSVPTLAYPILHCHPNLVLHWILLHFHLVLRVYPILRCSLPQPTSISYPSLITSYPVAPSYPVLQCTLLPSYHSLARPTLESCAILPCPTTSTQHISVLILLMKTYPVSPRKGLIHRMSRYLMTTRSLQSILHCILLLPSRSLEVSGLGWLGMG